MNQICIIQHKVLMVSTQIYPKLVHNFHRAPSMYFGCQWEYILDLKELITESVFVGQETIQFQTSARHLKEV